MDQAGHATRGDGPGLASGRAGGPLDPRLLDSARSTRRFLALSVLVGGVTALLVIAQAWLIALVVAGAFVHHRSLGSLRGALVALLGVIAARAGLAWAAERASARASASAKSELRRAAVEHVAALGPAGLEAARDREAQRAPHDRTGRARRLLRPATCPSSSWP